MTSRPKSAVSRLTVQQAVQRYWGFDALRPLQREAIDAALSGRDSLVVLPTGGGKSLCYQVPAVVSDQLHLVVSPLISLMKDQVDGLRACGYPATALHSALAPAERERAWRELRAGDVRLLFVSPERLVSGELWALLQRLRPAALAVDEAHCISHWGHDFRPEYRQLALLRQRLPEASVHAFTATATPRVREDIAQQLELREPAVLVGSFDRPNLTYRIRPRTDAGAQVSEIVAQHAGEAVIVYCLSRRDTESLAQRLQGQGVAADAYHAGLDAERRRRVQDAFAAEQLDVVVATVAFGMGIDRSNVRCVIHAAMPKSVEHYQQETGRAGRDGLEAECVLLYSAADVIRWRGLLESASQEGGEDEALQAALTLLGHMQGLCTTLECRHAALSRYFGQQLEPERCGACDVCLDEVQPMEGSTVVAQKILSCVARLRRGYGVGYLVDVLRGSEQQLVRQRGHDQLSTHGILRELPPPVLTNLVYQLVDQGLLERSPGERPVVQLNQASVDVLRGEREVRLLQPQLGRGKARRRGAEDAGWEGVDQALFAQLRALRREIAAERGVPAYIVFGDRTLRELARLQPQSTAAMSQVHGVGEKKLADLGPRFVAAILDYLQR